MKKPIIGIIPDYSTKKTQQGGYANFPWYALRADYLNAIEKSGGMPILLHYSQELIPDYLNICDGLILPGGDVDIHPSYYGEAISVKTINLDENNPIIEFEFKLLKAAINTNIPILGICAGFQLLNVVLGGSLYQDIKEQIKTDIIHIRTSEDNSKNIHPIEVVKESLLNKITNTTRYMVNSFHHQTIKKLGKGLKTSAIAPDGLIEAIELKDHPFCVGVEWHPEFQETNEDRKLFKAFVEAAEKYQYKSK